MTSAVLTAYVLVWPMIVAGVLFVICRAFMSEWAAARREGKPMI
ncbi:putative transporter small subunit [Streptomyces sp. XM4193]|nr:putative transporter small subunit [Streptomyces sp. XM4193]MCK1794492.1 putative transporter small subunit [Streptomyces sp. XM4193]